MVAGSLELNVNVRSYLSYSHALHKRKVVVELCHRRQVRGIAEIVTAMQIMKLRAEGEQAWYLNFSIFADV